MLILTSKASFKSYTGGLRTVKFIVLTKIQIMVHSPNHVLDGCGDGLVVVVAAEFCFDDRLVHLPTVDVSLLELVQVVQHLLEVV